MSPTIANTSRLDGMTAFATALTSASGSCGSRPRNARTSHPVGRGRELRERAATPALVSNCAGSARIMFFDLSSSAAGTSAVARSSMILIVSRRPCGRRRLDRGRDRERLRAGRQFRRRDRGAMPSCSRSCCMSRLVKPTPIVVSSPRTRSTRIRDRARRGRCGCPTVRRPCDRRSAAGSCAPHRRGGGACERLLHCGLPRTEALVEPLRASWHRHHRRSRASSRPVPVRQVEALQIVERDRRNDSRMPAPGWP